ncbi:hypothetical protein MNV84_04434 [Leishmania braziliensis]|nr:hypothetical protein MNV84_04434 [Leishmania braziliensis]
MTSSHGGSSPEELPEELRQQLATLQSRNDHAQESLTALWQQPNAPASDNDLPAKPHKQTETYAVERPAAVAPTPTYTLTPPNHIQCNELDGEPLQPEESLIEPIMAYKAEDYPGGAARRDVGWEELVDGEPPMSDTRRSKSNSAQAQVGGIPKSVPHIRPPPAPMLGEVFRRLPAGASLSYLRSNHTESQLQSHLSEFETGKPEIANSNELGVPLRGSANYARISSLVPRTAPPPSQLPDYLSLYASRNNEGANGGQLGWLATRPINNVDGQQSVLEQVSPLTPRAQDPGSTCATSAVSVAPAASAMLVATSTRAVARTGALTITVPARFELTSAENGDVVEYDTLARSRHWSAENPKGTNYTKPSALLEAKEKRECALFDRYSRAYEKLMQDTADHVDGEEGALTRLSHKAFKAAREAADRKPIHKRSFYEGASLDWKKTLLEQAADISRISNRTA